MNFEKFLGKLFCRITHRKHFSHDVLFFFFADHLGLQPKINSFGGAMVIEGKEFTRSLNAM